MLARMWVYVNKKVQGLFVNDVTDLDEEALDVIQQFIIKALALWEEGETDIIQYRVTSIMNDPKCKKVKGHTVERYQNIVTKVPRVI